MTGQRSTDTPSGSGVLSRYTAADRGLVETPLLTPHLAAHALGDGTVVLRSEGFDTALRGDCFADLLPLLDGALPRRAIIERLGGKHPAIDIQTALVFLASSGYVVSGEFGMDGETAAFWSSLGASPRWAEERLAAARVSVVGDAGRLPARLREMGLRTTRGEPTLSAVVRPDYLDGSLAAVNRCHLESGTPWLPLRPAGAAPLFGPVFRPAEGGPCWECLAFRMRANREAEGFARDAGVGDAALPTAGAPALAHAVHGLAAVEIAKWIVFGDFAPLHERAISLDPSDPGIARHRVVRRPQCRACGDGSLFRPDRAAVPVRLRSGAKPLRNSGGLRVVRPEETLGRYRHLVGPVSGVVNRLERISGRTDPWLHVYAAEMGISASADNASHATRRGTRLRSAGKGSTPRQSEASALCEALERISGTFAGDEIRHRRRFSDLPAGGADEAIHPNDVQLFSDRQFDRAERPAAGAGAATWIPARFDPDAEIDWTPVWSLTRERHRYLPTSLLYYDVPPEHGGAFCRGNSNGCAAGNTIEEAILQGFLELVERDCVAIWWYNRLKRPAVDLDSFGDGYLAESHARYRALRRDIWALDLTGDLGIPVFAAVSRRTDGGAERILYGFGAHFEPRIAALRAVCELNQMMPLFHEPDPGDPEEGEAWIVPWLNRARIADHLHMAPEPGAPARRMADYAVPDTGDVRDNIEHGRRLVEAKGLEFLVLDQTRPDIGMPVARVIVPGLRHYWRRLAPGRLYDVPVTMGWVDNPLAEADLNSFVIAG